MKNILRKSVLAASLLAAGLVGVDASAQNAFSPDPHQVKAGTYTVDPAHSQVIFSISHFGVTDFSGFLSGAAGTLTIDPAKLAATKLDVSVQIASLATTVPQLDDELKGDKWLDAGKFATATFKSTSVKMTGASDADVAGELTIRGITKPLTLKVHFGASGVSPFSKLFVAGFSATGQFKRSDYGVSTYLPLLGDNIDLKIAGSFDLKP